MRRPLHHTLAVVLTVLLAGSTVLLPTAADAASTGRDDPRDTQGDLDLERVRLTTSGERVVATFTTYAVASRDDLDGSNSLNLQFKVAENRTRDLLVQWLGDGLVASICTHVDSSPVSRNCSQVRVKRSGSRGIRVVIPQAKIKKDAKTYRWRATSVAWNRSAGCETGPNCEDLVPDNGKYLVWRT